MPRSRTEISKLVNVAQELSGVLTQYDIPHVIVGGIAVHLHGATRKDGDDIDIYIGAGCKETVIALLRDRRFKPSGKYFTRDDVKTQIKSEGEGFSSYPKPNCPSDWMNINGVRVPSIEIAIRTKAHACSDILVKVLTDGIGGPRRRSSLIKHTSDLIALVRIAGKKPGASRAYTEVLGAAVS
jgi:hypothetical protein